MQPRQIGLSTCLLFLCKFAWPSLDVCFGEARRTCRDFVYEDGLFHWVGGSRLSLVGVALFAPVDPSPASYHSPIDGSVLLRLASARFHDPTAGWLCGSSLVLN